MNIKIEVKEFEEIPVGENFIAIWRQTTPTLARPKQTGTYSSYTFIKVSETEAKQPESGYSLSHIDDFKQANCKFVQITQVADEKE